MNEQIEQLANYRQIAARIQVLEKYSVGNGITVSRLNGDDQLRELHLRLRGLPSYMYLTKREQRLETVAHAYLQRYPAGTRAQRDALPVETMDDEDEKLLRELRKKIETVIEARAGHVNDFDAVIARISELQDLQRQKELIDNALEALGSYKPEYELLKLRFVEGRSPAEAMSKLGISPRTFRRWQSNAIEAYAILTSS